MMEQLGRSIRDMTFCGMLLGILLTGFLLHVFSYRKISSRKQNDLLHKVLEKPMKALEQMSWFHRALLVVALVCAAEALVLGLAQYKVMHGEEMDGLRQWLTIGHGGWLIWGLWFLEKMILVPLVLRTARGMTRLRDSGRELAKGNLGYQLSLEGMKGETLQFGRDLNAISQAVADAVEDRMKRSI